jgi:hypothetical protein
MTTNGTRRPARRKRGLIARISRMEDWQTRLIAAAVLGPAGTVAGLVWGAPLFAALWPYVCLAFVYQGYRARPRGRGPRR